MNHIGYIINPKDQFNMARYDYNQSNKYQSFLNEDILALQQQLINNAQQRYDTSYGLALQAKDTYLQTPVDLEEVNVKNKLVSGFSDEINKLVNTKYSGDWGAASKEIASKVTNMRSNPFWDASRSASKIREREIEYKTKLGADALVSNSLIGRSIVDDEGNILSADKMQPVMIDRRQVANAWMEKHGSSAQNKRESGIHKTNNPQYLKATTILGLTSDEVDQQFAPGTENAAKEAVDSLLVQPELKKYLDSLYGNNDEAKIAWVENFNYDMAKENLVKGSVDQYLQDEMYLARQKKAMEEQTPIAPIAATKYSKNIPEEAKSVKDALSEIERLSKSDKPADKIRAKYLQNTLVESERLVQQQNPELYKAIYENRPTTNNEETDAKILEYLNTKSEFRRSVPTTVDSFVEKLAKEELGIKKDDYITRKDKRYKDLYDRYKEISEQYSEFDDWYAGRGKYRNIGFNNIKKEINTSLKQGTTLEQDIYFSPLAGNKIASAMNDFVGRLDAAALIPLEAKFADDSREKDDRVEDLIDEKQTDNWNPKALNLLMKKDNITSVGVSSPSNNSYPEIVFKTSQGDIIRTTINPHQNGLEVLREITGYLGTPEVFYAATLSDVLITDHTTFSDIYSDFKKNDSGAYLSRRLTPEGEVYELHQPTGEVVDNFTEKYKAVQGLRELQ
jgi:hypothetical protein